MSKISFVNEKRIDKKCIFPSDEFSDFYDGHGSVLDSQDYIHPWFHLGVRAVNFSNLKLRNGVFNLPIKNLWFKPRKYFISEWADKKECTKYFLDNLLFIWNINKI